ncbi:MAG: hypothetical protein RL722_1410 [Pseudomonadota bacterium]
MASPARGAPGTQPALPAQPLLSAAAQAAIDPALRQVEQELASLGDALRQHDAGAMQAHAPVLQQALAEVVKLFGRIGGQGSLPPELWQRLNAASRQVAEQRQTVLRNSLIVDRAVAQLVPATSSAAPAGHRASLASAYRA